MNNKIKFANNVIKVVMGALIINSNVLNVIKII
jgi:hypothetical protein